MADVDEGLNPKPLDFTARQRLGHLRSRLWPLQTLLTKYTAKTIEAPKVLEFLVMEKRERWIRVGGPAGENTTYELER